MVVFGLLCMLGAGSLGGFIAWQTRDVIVRLDLGPLVWTGHLYAVLVVGALLACWFLLGAAFVQCRIAERRQARRVASSPADAPPSRPLPRAEPARP